MSNWLLWFYYFFSLFFTPLFLHRYSFVISLSFSLSLLLFYLPFILAIASSYLALSRHFHRLGPTSSLPSFRSMSPFPFVVQVVRLPQKPISFRFKSQQKVLVFSVKQGKQWKKK